jgi:hypothetical protein
MKMRMLLFADSQVSHRRHYVRSLTGEIRRVVRRLTLLLLLHHTLI